MTATFAAVRPPAAAYTSMIRILDMLFLMYYRQYLQRFMAIVPYVSPESGNWLLLIQPEVFADLIQPEADLLQYKQWLK
jgi:hypothetical protein